MTEPSATDPREEPDSVCRVTELKDGIRVIALDIPSTDNRLDRAVLEELESILADLEVDPRVCGIVITSAKPGTFAEGAARQVLHETLPDLETLGAYTVLGQRVCNQLAGMTAPTIAVIDGPCEGEAFELALACKYRIATPVAEHTIGLPQTRYGLLPAWGGCTRLPRLTGIEPALRLILAAKTVSPQTALALEMIDELAPREVLLDAAVLALREGRVNKRRLTFRRNPVAQALAGAVLFWTTRWRLKRRTRGWYPALHQALRVVVRGARAFRIEGALIRERVALRDLANNEECHLLLRFDRLRFSKGTGQDDSAPVGCIAVTSASLTGAGIVHCLSGAGIRVLWLDRDAQRLGVGMDRVCRLFERMVASGHLTLEQAHDTVERITPVSGESSLAGGEWIIDAALPIARVSGPEFTENPPCLHFLRPIHRVPLVEVVVRENTAPSAISRLVRFVRQIGKVPVVVMETPGLLVNRVLVSYLLEGAAAFSAGVSAHGIDNAMLDFGMSAGVLRMMDDMGLDILLEIAKPLAAVFPDRISIPPILNAMVEAGLLGRKSGAGFYVHPREWHPSKLKPNPVAGDLRQGSHSAGIPPVEMVEQRIMFRMLDEAVRCLEEQVAENADQIDLGLILGTGFPPFRGGPLRYVDDIGTTRLVKEMTALGLPPCERLRAMAPENRRFYGEENRW